jgi:hypothetical protein
MLARKPKVGPPRTIAIKQGEKFSGEECRDALERWKFQNWKKGLKG